MWPRPRCWRLVALWLWSTTRLRLDNTRCLQCSVRPTCPVTATCASWRSWIGKHRSWGCRQEIDESCWREVCCWLLGVGWWGCLWFSVFFHIVFVVLCSWWMILLLCGQWLAHRCFFMRSPSLASMEAGSTPTGPWAPTQVWTSSIRERPRQGWGRGNGDGKQAPVPKDIWRYDVVDYKAVFQLLVVKFDHPLPHLHQKLEVLNPVSMFA